MKKLLILVMFVFFLVLPLNIFALGLLNESYKTSGENDNLAWFDSERYMPPLGPPFFDLNPDSEDFTLLWNYTTGGGVESSALIYGNLIYIGSDDGNVYALNRSDGGLIWSYQTNGSVKSSLRYGYSYEVGDYFIYFGSNDGNIYSLDPNNGTKIWNYTTNGSVESSALVYNYLVYIGSDDGNVYALNNDNGSLIWSYQTNGSVKSSPIIGYASEVENYLVYIGSDDGNVYALNNSNGELIWNYTTGGSVRGSPITGYLSDIGSYLVYIGSDDGNVYALNSSDGGLVWSYATGDSVKSSLRIYNNIIYVGSDDGNVYALNSSDGNLIWSYATGGSVRGSPGVIESKVHIGSDDGVLYALDVFSGLQRWNYTVNGSIRSSLSIFVDSIENNSKIYFGSDDGNVYALGTSVWSKYNSNDYLLISEPDGDFVQYSDTSKYYDASYHRFNISQDPDDVIQLDFYFKGYSDTSSTSAYVYNFRTGNWDFLDSVEQNGEFFLKSLRRDSIDDSIFNDYLNESLDGNYLWLVTEAMSTAGGSCPFVYSYDGDEYWFDHEGFAFATMSIAESSSFGRLENLKAVDGNYIIKIGERLDETSWVNGFELKIVDHPGESVVIPDVNGELHTIQKEVLPSKCLSKNNKDCLGLVVGFDSLFYSSNKDLMDLDSEDYYDWIELEFGNLEMSREGKLVLKFQSSELLKKEWAYYINLIGKNNWETFQKVMEFPLFKKWHSDVKERSKLQIQIWDGDEWKEVERLGSGREKWMESLVLLDLFDEENVRIRLKQNTGNYEINQVYMDFSEDEEMKITILEPISVLKNSSDVISDVEEELADFNDDKYVELNKGDDIDLVYNEIESYEDWKRDYVVSIKGYYNYDIFKEKTKSEFLKGASIWLRTAFDDEFIFKNLDKILSEFHHTLYIDYLDINVSYLTGNSSINSVVMNEPAQNESYAKEYTFPMNCSVGTGGGSKVGLFYQFKTSEIDWVNIPVSSGNLSLETSYSEPKLSEFVEKLYSVPSIGEEELRENKDDGLRKEWVRMFFKDDKQVDYAVSMRLDVVGYGEDSVEAVVTTREIEKLRENGIEVEILPFNRGDVFSKEGFEDYHNYSEIVSDLEAIEGNYSDIAKIYDIGKSIENRTLWAIKISDNVVVDENESEIFIIGNHHAREIMTPEILLYQIHYLVENYEIDYKVKMLVDNREVWFVPVMNPDGLVYVQTNDTMWRKNRRDNGNGSFGVDLNRNYGYKWGYDDIGSSPYTYEETYRGPSAFSEPESQAVRDFVESRNISYALSYHSYGDMLLYPWGYIINYTDDHDKFLELAEGLTQNLPYYRKGVPGELLYTTNGDFDDWMYGEQTSKNKTFGLTFEVNNDAQGGFRPDPSYIIPTCEEHVPPLLYLLEVAGPEIEIPIEIDENKEIDVLDGRSYSHIIKPNKKGEYDIRCLLFNSTDSIATEARKINILVPSINISLVDPPAEVRRNEIFDFQINISCSGFDCGNLSAYLDPEVSDPGLEEGFLEDSKNGYIVEFVEEPAFVVSIEKHKRINMLKRRIESRDFAGLMSVSDIEKEKKQLEKEIEADISNQLVKIKDTHDKFKKEASQKIGSGEISALGFSVSDLKIRQEYSKIFNGISLDISREEAEKLLDLPYVKKIHPNGEYKIIMDYTIPWLNVDDVWSYSSHGFPLTGNGVVIANLDTGIEVTHPMFGHDNHSVFKKCDNFTNCSKVLDAWDFVFSDAEPWDDNGHGTHTASTNAGIDDGVLQGGMAPDAKLYVYKICNAGGSCQWDYIMGAVERASDPNNDGNYSDHANLISMSVGGGGTPDDPTSIAFDNAADIGVIGIVSAGNSGPSKSTIACPSCARKVISVAAACKPFDVGNLSQCPDDIAGFSSRGPLIYNDEDLKKPEIIAPGVWICAARGVGYQGGSGYPTCFDDKHVRVSGTSMSCPHVAGIGALIVQDNPDITWDEFEKLIQDTAVSLGNYSYDDQGAGLINPEEALGTITINYIRTEPELIGRDAIVNCIASVSIKNISHTLESVKFTIKNSSDVVIMDGVIGNQSGDIWTSPEFIADNFGDWTCEIEASDNTNRSKTSFLVFSVGEKGLISTNMGDEPFYTLDSNPESCYDLKENKSCIVSWRVVPTGQLNTTWEFFSYVNSLKIPYLTDITEKISLKIIQGAGFIVDLISPEDGSVSSGHFEFNCSVVNSSFVKELALYTNISGWGEEYRVYNSSFLSYVKNNISEGIYEWNCLALNESGGEFWSIVNYTFTIALYVDEDVNEDGSIDIQDLVAVAIDIGSLGCNSGNNWCNRRDVTKDGEVDIQDLVKVAINLS